MQRSESETTPRPAGAVENSRADGGLQVERLTLREIQLPLRENFRISSGTRSLRRIALLTLHGDDDTSVWSECVAPDEPNYSPESVDTAWLAITRWLAPRVLGRTFSGPEEVFPALDRDLRGHRMAKAAIEMGFWNLAAVQKGLPLARLLGETRPRVETGISLGIERSPSALADRVEEAVDAGYCKIKLKIEPGADVRFVRTAREAAGEQVSLAVDGNAAYRLSDREVFEELDELGLLMIEQPLEGEDLLRHAELQSKLETPICLDESLNSPARVEDMHRLGSGRVVNLKPARVGGFVPSLAIHRYCRDNGIPLWCGGMLESGIGRAYNVALASLPAFSMPGDLSPSRRYWERDVVTPEWTMDNAGRVDVPLSSPGLGVDVDRDRVDDLTVRSERLTA